MNSASQANSSYSSRSAHNVHSVHNVHNVQSPQSYTPRTSPHVSQRLKAAWSILAANPLVKTPPEDRSRKFTQNEILDYISQISVTLAGALTFSREDSVYVRTLSDMARTDVDAFKSYLQQSGQHHLALATTSKIIVEMLGVSDILWIKWDRPANSILVGPKHTGERSSDERPSAVSQPEQVRSTASRSPRHHQAGPHQSYARKTSLTDGLKRPSFRDICAVGVENAPVADPLVADVPVVENAPVVDASGVDAAQRVSTLQPQVKARRPRGGKKVRELKARAAENAKLKPQSSSCGSAPAPLSSLSPPDDLLANLERSLLEPDTTDSKVETIDVTSNVDAAAQNAVVQVKNSARELRDEFQAVSWDD